MKPQHLREVAQHHRELAAKALPKGTEFLMTDPHTGKPEVAVSKGSEPYLRQAEAAEANALAYEMFGEAYKVSDNMAMHEAAREERRNRGIGLGQPTYPPQPKKKKRR